MKEKQGNLAKIGMPKLLHLIYQKGDGSGMLDIVREPVKKRFIFANGVPAAASSNILNEVLGRLLMQEGVITQQDYERSLEVVIKEKRKHGQVLISMGLITEAQLDTFLTLQVKRRIFKIFGWNEGTYRYVKSTGPAPEALALQLHPAALILEGISLGFYPASRIMIDLNPHLDTPVSVAQSFGKYTLADFNLNLQEKRFLESIDGKKTLREALDASDLLRHRALSLALSFIITGIIESPAEVEAEEFFEEETHAPETAEAPLVKKLNAEILFMKAKNSLDKRNYERALKILTEITDLNPMEGEYWAYLGWATYLDNPASLKRAERIIKDAIDLNNDLDIAWHFLGTLALASGDTNLARAAFRTAIEKNPWMLQSVAEQKRLEIMDTGGRVEDLEKKKEYLDAFGFTEDPFDPVPDQAHTYLDGSRLEALDSLVRAVRKRSGPVLLTGAAGTGKTTLAIELLRRLSSEKILASVLLKPAARELPLMKEINAGVGVYSETSSIKELLLALGMRVSQNKIQGGQTLVVIDRADRLTDGCLKLLKYLSRLKTLQIVLVGEPELEHRLKGADFTEFDQKISARVRLGSMSIDETRDYFLKRLKNARSTIRTDWSITDEALVLLYDECGGAVAAINRKAVRLLAEAARDRTSEIDNLVAMTAFGRRSVLESAAAAEVFVEEAFGGAGETARPATAPPEEAAGVSEMAPERPAERPAERPVKAEAVYQKPVETPVPPERAPQEARKAAPVSERIPSTEKPLPATEPTEPRAEHKKRVRVRRTSKLLILLFLIALAALIVAYFKGALYTGAPEAPETPSAPSKPAEPQAPLPTVVVPEEKAAPGLSAPEKSTTAPPSVAAPLQGSAAGGQGL